MKNINEFILSLGRKRVWWKPWTWIRRSPLIAYWPLTDGEAQAVNPAIALERMLEISTPDIPHDWDGQSWLVTGHTEPGYQEWSRIIYVNYITPESLAKLGFHGDPASIVIRPREQWEKE